MIDLDNQTQLTIDIDRLEAILQPLSHQDIELIITNNENIRELNREYRGKDSPTDVLSFPLEQYSDNIPLGSIVISADYVILKASEFDHTIQDELSLLFIHGVLHLLGYDHEIDDAKMRAKEVEIIEEFSLPKSLIVRTTTVFYGKIIKKR